MNNDLKKLLENAGLKFAGEPAQKPGDQVRGTEKAVVRGRKHPFQDRLVGEDTTLEDSLAKKYYDMKELARKEPEVDEAAPGFVRHVAGAALGALAGAGGAVGGHMIGGPVGAVAGGAALGAKGYKSGMDAADAVWDKFAGKKKQQGDVEEAAVAPVVGAVPAVGAVPGAAPGLGATPVSPADAMKQKADQRKAIQDQITAANEQLTALRTQLASIK